ncbi:MAG: exopolyphosphatase [Deltaproteobacteria bacterium]|jgi:nanoRNase/pAp phosphatase (c-di-AMP/oligoRNAs hydrolase)|nr:exopolyphosphatase [Deltaproteobacteria bacterium]
MRLVTRSDFDGLACAVLLKHLGLIDDYLFAHPKDLQDEIIEINSNDILANVPYVPGCGIWFDHHTSEMERLGNNFQFNGRSAPLPSCARVIWEYYGGSEKFPSELAPMMEAVDKVDSAQLSREDILNPQEWVLLGFMMDPRTGLGRYHDYRISNYQLMMAMIDFCSRMSAEEILHQFDVQERTRRYFSQQKDFSRMLSRCSKLIDNVLLTDLRNEEEIFSGNRFTVYAMYPQCNASVQVMWGLRKERVVLTVGYSILNRTCSVDVGSLMLSYGGGGHPQVGTCQVPPAQDEQTIREVVAALRDCQ